MVTFDFKVGFVLTALRYADTYSNFQNKYTM